MTLAMPADIEASLGRPILLCRSAACENLTASRQWDFIEHAHF
jgi:hypothetical protein